MYLASYMYFLDYKTHFPPQIWEENGGASYSHNVAYLAHYRISALKDVICLLYTSDAADELMRV